MNFDLTDEQLQMKQLARDIGKRYQPFVLEWDRDGIPRETDQEMIRALRDHDLLGMVLPEEYGGQGRPFLDMILVLEELAKLAPPLAAYLFTTCAGPVQILIKFGSEELKKKYLPPLVRGEALVAVAMTEADAGSAVTELQTSAVLDGDDYVLNGTKVFVGGAGRSELYVVYARMNDKRGASGIGALIVEKDTPGLEFGRDLALLGLRYYPRFEMIFRDCRVPKQNLLVRPGEFGKLMGSFNTERVVNTALSLGFATGAFEDSLEYVQQRRQFGRELVEFQMIQEMLADMAMELEAARLLLYKAASLVQDGSAPALESSLAKAFANRVARRVTDKAVQIHGAYGLSPDYRIQYYWRDARSAAIASGTEQMQKIRIVSELTGRRFVQWPTSGPSDKAKE